MNTKRWTRSLLTLAACASLLATYSARANAVKTVNVVAPAITMASGVLLKNGQPFTGHWVEHYANGQLKRDAQYRHGRLNGVTRGWFDSGKAEYERHYTVGLESGTHRGWYESGARRFEYQFTNGAQNGVQHEWFESGREYTLFHYTRGHENGAQQMWNEDGTLRANYVIRDGRRYGLPGSTGCRGAADSMNGAKP